MNLITTRLTEISPVYMHWTYKVNPLLIWDIQAVLTLGIGRSGGARHTLPQQMVPRRGTVGSARRDM